MCQCRAWDNISYRINTGNIGLVKRIHLDDSTVSLDSQCFQADIFCVRRYAYCRKDNIAVNDLFFSGLPVFYGHRTSISCRIDLLDTGSGFNINAVLLEDFRQFF